MWQSSQRWILIILIYMVHHRKWRMLLCNSLKNKTGRLFVSKCGLKRSDELNAAHHYTYSFNDPVQSICCKYEVENGAYRYTVKHKEWKLNDVACIWGAT